MDAAVTRRVALALALLIAAAAPVQAASDFYGFAPTVRVTEMVGTTSLSTATVSGSSAAVLAYAQAIPVGWLALGSRLRVTVLTVASGITCPSGASQTVTPVLSVGDLSASTTIKIANGDGVSTCTHNDAGPILTYYLTVTATPGSPRSLDVFLASDAALGYAQIVSANNTTVDPMQPQWLKFTMATDGTGTLVSTVRGVFIERLWGLPTRGIGNALP